MDPFCYSCFLSVMLSCLFIASFWSLAGKRPLGSLERGVFLCFYHFLVWCPGSGMVLDCINS